jgi:hypothetical protein
MRLRNSLAAILIALPFVVACGTDCYDICDDAQDEGCTDFDHDDCVHGCVAQEDFSEVSDECDSEFEKYVDCVADLDNICKAVPDPDEPDEEECNDERLDYIECVVDYCADHSNRDWCN